MDVPAAGQLATLLYLSAAWSASFVQAQLAPGNREQGLGVELHYEALAGCPARDAFVKNLKARRRGATGDTVMRLEVRLRAVGTGSDRVDRGNRVEGTITVTARDGAHSERRIEATTCGEASDALALIAALAFEGIAIQETIPGVGTKEAKTTGWKGSATRRRSAALRRDAGGSREERADATGRSRAKALETQVEVDTEVGEGIEDMAEIETTATSKTEDTVVARTEDETEDEYAQAEAGFGQPDPVRAHLLLSGGLGFGALPNLQSLLELSLNLEYGAPGTLLPSIQVGARISPSQTHSFDEGVVTFNWWSGSISLCLGAHDSTARLSFSGCASLEAGVLTGRGRETERPRDEQRPWLAPGPGLSLTYDAFEALRLQLQSQALTPLVRDRFLLANSTIHQPASLQWRAGLGVGLKLW